ncbi:22095_t:CDS:2, partial [Cetraspora pellucida]
DSNNKETKLCKQIKDIKSSGKNSSIYDKVKSARFNYQTHPQAIYTSRLLYLQKLPEPAIVYTKNIVALALALTKSSGHNKKN